ncbi:uncharacterized protein LOC119985520 [Tripterygium wilfordii]|uniref:uncharacterized protein LOC119985520 n=1 Tax=Tripterygium wilfordii TaxID=458696 RepID=UPI0018F84E26|nr:uncharacterized protein LOC119985520 [Tripterygium wilfordii]
MAKCYILASLLPVLQKQHESMQTAGDMIFSLQEMFQQSTRPARQQAIKKLMNAKQAEGTPVREHMLKVMEYLYEALDLGAEIDGQTQMDMVLETLSSSFSQFKLNFNMNKMEMSLPMLMKELQSAEQIMGKERSCLEGKMTKRSFKSKGLRANDLLALVHTDVCGPMTVQARGGFEYFITFTDDYSRHG